MSRHSCLDCVRKHLAQASILLDESVLGYPHHRWLAAGHLAEAESESIREHLKFAKKIRKCRIRVMQKKKLIVCIEELIREACILAGDLDDIKDSKINSKTFETKQKKKKEKK